MVSDVTLAPVVDLMVTLSTLRPREALRLAPPLRLTLGSPNRADAANHV